MGDITLLPKAGRVLVVLFSLERKTGFGFSKLWKVFRRLWLKDPSSFERVVGSRRSAANISLSPSGPLKVMRGGDLNGSLNLFVACSGYRSLTSGSCCHFRSLSSDVSHAVQALEDTANGNPSDAYHQYAYLRRVLHMDPEYVVRRVESGKYAVDSNVREVYVEAIRMTRSGAHQGDAGVAAKLGGSASLPPDAKSSLKLVLTLVKRTLVFATLFYVLFVMMPGWPVKFKISSNDIDFPSIMTPKFRNEAIEPSRITTRFSDVKGSEESKQELVEIVDFLSNPEKYETLGGRISSGVLLIGPPGTGKTMLAKAVAGEANVPFYYATGSEFDEMFVGVGASRIRKLFEKARSTAPCILFIDELDAVGSKRNESEINPFSRMTLNQLLTEMDGFKENNVVVIGATNSPQILDPALVRAGRFDVRIYVPLPSYKDRIEILDYYLNKVIRNNDISVERLARLTPGASGADLSNLVNQGAIRAASRNATSVTMKDLEWARDKIEMGRERRSMLISDEEKKRTAIHEAGHAIVAFYTPSADKLHKVSIIPRGSSLGHTQSLPHKEETLLTYSQLLAKLDVCMGGRVAEEIFYGKSGVSTGCTSDLKQATAIAKNMVKDCGFSKRVGYVDMDKVASSSFSSGCLDTLVHEEVKSLLDESYARACQLLESKYSDVKSLADALMVNETMCEDQVKKLLSQ